jgi:hypothetical protein
MNTVVLHGLIVSGDALRTDAPAHRLIAMETLQAIVSDTTLPPETSELSEDQTAQAALFHNEILVKYCEAGDVLPIRFGAAFSSDAAVVSHVASDAVQHLTMIRRLSDSKEFALRLVPAAQQHSKHEDAVAPASGRDFLTRRMTTRNNRKTISERRHTFAKALATRIGGHVSSILAAETLRADRLVDLTLLVPTANITALVSESAQLYVEARDLGLDLHMTGPWPPYSYASIEVLDGLATGA